MRFVCDACQDITNIEVDRMEDGNGLRTNRD